MKTIIENLKKQVRALHEEISRLEEEYLKTAGKPNPLSKGGKKDTRELTDREKEWIHSFMEDWGPVSLHSLASYLPTIPVNAIYFYFEQNKHKFTIDKAGRWSFRS